MVSRCRPANIAAAASRPLRTARMLILITVPFVLRLLAVDVKVTESPANSGIEMISTFRSSIEFNPPFHPET